MSCGSERSRMAAAGLVAGVLLGGFVGNASAQTPCTTTVRGWLGVSGLACNCTVQTGGTPVWEFRSEPRVIELAAGSPAAAVLRPGDMIVAVDGVPITTEQAGRRFGAPEPSTPMVLTIRRNGGLQDVRITPDAVCEGDARLEPATPMAPSRLVPLRTPPAGAAATGARPRAATRAPTPLGRVVPSAGLVRPPGQPRQGWFGFGIRCSHCGWEQGDNDPLPRWSFTESPELEQVADGSPADRAGLRAGDVLAEIDGVPLVSAEGGRAFGAVRPGQTVRWTYLRGGQRRVATVRAIERGLRPVPAPLESVRFRDMVGNVVVEVEGGPDILTTVVEDGRYLIIDTGTARIRVRVVNPDRPRDR
jgi:membrane-associated protease RseP (regulator of RpoE activity)